MTTRGVFDDAFYNPLHVLPTLQYGTTAVASGTLLANQTSGAQETVLQQSGATALTLPTAASVFAALAALLPNMGYVPGVGGNVPQLVGVTYKLRVINTNAGTLTLTAGTGNTLTGTATLATNTWREFLVTITSPITVTYQAIGTGTQS